MTTKLEELQAKAKKLDTEERAQLACFLLETLDTVDSNDVSHAWDIEIAARWAEIERGDVELISASKVFADLRRKLG